jgi:uncharacterized membrane protein
VAGAKKTKTNSMEVASVVHRNIEALLEMRNEHERRKKLQDRVADQITRFTGSMKAVYVNIVAILVWIGINSRCIPGLKPFDPYPFPLLAMFASIEAIFLSTFVLISQNRTELLSEKRADLDVQINLLSEHEITRLIQMVDAISNKLGVNMRKSDNIEELKKDIAPETVLETIEKAKKNREL